MTTETRKGGRKKTRIRMNRYGDDFLFDTIQSEKLGEVMVNVGNLIADEEWQIMNDSEHSWREDHTSPEKEADLEQNEIERREKTNRRILEWMHGLQADDKETQSIQQVDISAGKHLKGGNSLFGWTATDRQLEKPPDNLSPAPLTGTSIITFFRGVGWDLPTPKFLNI